MKHNIRAALLAAFVGLFVSSASLEAGTVGPNCGSCYGSIYTLGYLGQVAAVLPNTEIHRISLTIDASGFVEPGSAPNQYISSIALKVTNSLIWASLDEAPGNENDWIVQPGGLSNGNCNGSGSGYFCAQDLAPNAAQTNVASPIYTWVFRVTMAAGSLFDGENQAHIKANYDPRNGYVVSEDITLGGEVPEPAALSLLAAGFGVWAWSRRRTQSSIV